MPRPSNLSRERKIVNGRKLNYNEVLGIAEKHNKWWKNKKMEGANTKKKGKTSIHF